MAFKNKRAGICCICDVKVQAEGGLCFRQGQTWKVVCSSSQCQARALGGDAPAASLDVRELRADGVVLMPIIRDDGTMDYDALAIIKGMPGARWHAGTKVWSVSLAPHDRVRVLDAATRLGLAIAPELLVVEQSPLAEQAMSRAANGGAYSFQVEGVHWLASHRYAVLGDDMGLGKTAQTLWAHDGQGLIVICPKSLLLNWKAEVAKWRPDLTVIVCDSSSSLVIPKPGQVSIINYDVLPRVMRDYERDEWMEQLRKDKKIRAAADKLLAKGAVATDAVSVRLAGSMMDAALDAAVAAEVAKTRVMIITEEGEAALARCQVGVDEAHRVKNYKAKRSMAVKALRRKCAGCWAITGTPLPNRPLDLYGVLETCGMEKIVFGGFGGFLRTFNGRKGRFGYEFGMPDPSAPEKLRRVMIRRLKTEVLKDLPGRTRSTMIVNDLPASLRRQMDRAWDEWMASNATDEDLERRSELPDFSEFSEIRAALAKSRIAAAHEWCEDREEEGAPVLVFSAHRAPVEEIGAREGWAALHGDTPVAERQRIVEAFQRGELKGLALTITAGGVGITLTRASTALFIDLDWTPANNLQAEDRMIRIGQLAQSVHIVRMVSSHILDAHVLKLLDEKTALVEAAVERLMAYEIPKASGGITTVEETEEAFEARMAARAQGQRQAQADLEREAAQRKIVAALGRVRGGGGGAAIPETFSDEVADALRGVVTFLAEQCDGAVAKDLAGFNKPDAAMGHWLALTGMTDLASLQLAWAITRKYVRQAGKEFPAAYRVTKEAV